MVKGLELSKTVDNHISKVFRSAAFFSSKEVDSRFKKGSFFEGSRSLFGGILWCPQVGKRTIRKSQALIVEAFIANVRRSIFLVNSFASFMCSGYVLAPIIPARGGEA